MHNRAAEGQPVMNEPTSTEWMTTLRLVIGAMEKAICTGSRCVLLVTLPPGAPGSLTDLQSPADAPPAAPATEHPPPG